MSNLMDFYYQVALEGIWMKKHSLTLQSNLNLVDIQDPVNWNILTYNSLGVNKGNVFLEKIEKLLGKISSPVNYHSEKSFSAKHLDIILKSGLTVNQQSENKMWWSILCQSPTTTFEEKPSSKVFNSSNRCDVEKKLTTQLKTRKKNY